MKKTPMDIEEIIRNATLPERTLDVCLDEDLAAEYESLAERNAGTPSPELDAQLEKLAEQIRAATLTLTVRALPRPRFRELVHRHPPRTAAEGERVHMEDLSLGVNYDSFFDELLRVSVVDPVLDEATLRVLVEEKLTDAQHQALTDLCWNVNRTAFKVPAAVLAKD